MQFEEFRRGNPKAGKEHEFVISLTMQELVLLNTAVKNQRDRSQKAWKAAKPKYMEELLYKVCAVEGYNNMLKLLSRILSRDW